MPAPKRIKKQEHEKLTDANIAHVIALLEAEKPITKKDACEILNISYNTNRLNSILDDWKAKKELQAKRRAEKRGTPVTQQEIGAIAESYLNGDSIHDISNRVYRPADAIKRIIEQVGIPARVSGEEKIEIEILPEKCISYEFKKGDIVWSAKYHAACEIDKVLDQRYESMYDSPCYRVWIREPSEELAGGFFAMCPAYDLGTLEHLKEYGVRLETL